jgi:hypothetical protein
MRRPKKMADDRWTTWQAEAAGTHRLPTIWSAFLVFGLLAALALALAAGPTTTAQSGERSQGSLCAEHRADRAWAAICEDARRR